MRHSRFCSMAIIASGVIGCQASLCHGQTPPMLKDAGAGAATAHKESIVAEAPDGAAQLNLPDPSLSDLDSLMSPLELVEDDVAALRLPDFPGPADAPAALPSFRLESISLAVTSGLAPPRRLAIREAVRMALENNTDIKVQRLQPELGQQEIRFAKGAFDPQLSFSTQYDYSETPQNAVEFVSTGGLVQTFNDPQVFTSENFGMNWQLGGKTPMGTQYSIGLNQLQSRNDINIQIPPSLFFPEYTSVLGLSVIQPLLRGFGPAANLAELRVARVQKQIGWYDWQQQIIRSLSETISFYLDLVFASENLKVREEAVRTARLLEEQNIRRVRAGKMRPADVWEAQTAVASNADTALRAANLFIESQNSLKARILPLSEVASGPTGRLDPVDDLRIPEMAMDRTRFIMDAFANRPEYLKFQAELEKEGIRLRFARNQIYPQVDLQASYGLTGLEGNFGSSFNEAFGGQGPAFAVGVLFSVPLGSQKELAALESAKLRQEQAQLGVERASIEIILDVDTVMGFVETTRKQVEAAAQATRSAKLTAEAQEKLLEEGKATTFDVVRLQSDYADASTRELAALANYRKAVLRLSVARGTLLEELGVSLEEEAEQIGVADSAGRAGNSDLGLEPLRRAVLSDPTQDAGRQAQKISFESLQPCVYGRRPFNLTAWAESKGPVEFDSSNPRVAVVDDRRLTIVGAGTATITARQGGSAEWMPVEASQVFTVTRAPQKISFSAPRVPRFAPGRTFELEARASSGGRVRFTAEPAGIVSISGSMVTMLQPGRVIITALQAGTKDFEAAETSRSLKLR
jgi:outer membrane protein